MFTYIVLFFWDISSKILKESDVGILKENISLNICNLKKIFPPSLLDFMEHLLVHLPNEALGGPVQFRWMYVFEKSCGKKSTHCGLDCCTMYQWGDFKFILKLYLASWNQKVQEIFFSHTTIRIYQSCSTMKGESVDNVQLVG